MKNVLYFLAALIIVSVGLYYLDWNRNRLNQLAFGNLNLQLTGVVYKLDKVSGFNGFGIANLRILKSNIKMYDPRQKDNYYCMVKSGKVEIYDIHVSAMSIGDTIKIDTRKKVIYYLNAGKKEEGSTIVNTDNGFYRYIQKYHQKI